jgi:hypothetical protein
VRSLFLIPAFLLFLSNIPFIHKMERQQRMDMVKQDGCCKKKEAMQTCRMEDGPEPSCHAPSDNSLPVEKECNMQSESVCICVCCFQFAAPDQLGTKFQFHTPGIQQSLAVYLHQHWKDPMLALPWQPPDNKLMQPMS